MNEPMVAHRPAMLSSFPVPGPIGSPGAIIVRGDVYLAGWSLRETTGAAVAQVDIIDGLDTSGRIVASLNFAAGANSIANFGGHLLTARTGLFVAVNAGTIFGALWFAEREGGPRRHVRRE